MVPLFYCIVGPSNIKENIIVKSKSIWIKIGKLFLDITEIYIPAIAFSLLFIAFLIQVFFRYFLVPLTWPLEFTLMMFIWATLFGACYAMRDDSHVRFTLVYDNAAPKVKFWMRIIGNLMLLSSFIIAFIPTYNWVNFMSFKKSNVLKVPMNIVFFPYVIFMIIMIGRIAYNLYIDIRKLPRGEV